MLVFGKWIKWLAVWNEAMHLSAPDAVSRCNNERRDALDRPENCEHGKKKKKLRSQVHTQREAWWRDSSSKTDGEPVAITESYVVCSCVEPTKTCQGWILYPCNSEFANTANKRRFCEMVRDMARWMKKRVNLLPRIRYVRKCHDRQSSDLQICPISNGLT